MRLQPEHPVGLHRLILALDRDLAQVPDIEQGGDQLVCVRADLHGSGDSRLFHARRQIDGVAHGRVFARLGGRGPNLADDCRAGVDPDPYGERESVVFLKLPGKAPDSGDDTQPGQNGTLGIVFMGQRCAEEGQNGVAHQAGHHAAIAFYRPDHVPEGFVHHLGPFLGIELGSQGR